MTTVNLNHIQFWAPPPKPLLHKQHTASSHSTSKYICTTSSRNGPAQLCNRTDRISKRNNQLTSTIVPVQYQEDNSVAGAKDLTSRDDKTDDDFPLIKELLGQISHKGVSAGEYWNPEDTLQQLEEPALDTSGSCLSPTQARVDESISGSQGTRDRPVILEDNESDTRPPNPEATTELIRRTDPSNCGLWYDIEDKCYADDGLRSIPLLEQEGLASTPTPAEEHSHSLHHPLQPCQDPVNQYTIDRTTLYTLEKPGPCSLSTLLSKNNGRGSEEKVISKLEKDLLLAFEEQEKLSLAPASISPGPYCSSAEVHSQIDQEHDQSENSYDGLEEFRHSTPLYSQDQEEDVRIEVMRGEEDNGNNKEQGPEREKHQRQENEEISYDNHHHQGGDYGHNTNDEDDEPRPGNRRRVPLTPTSNALTPPNDPMEEMQEGESIDDNSSEDECCSHYNDNEYEEDEDFRPTKLRKTTLRSAIPKSAFKLPRRLVSPIPIVTDNAQDQMKGSSSTSSKRHNPLQPFQSPSATAESIPAAEYHEWPLHGFFKRTRIGMETTLNLEFHLNCLPEDLEPSAAFATLDSSFGMGTLTQSQALYSSTTSERPTKRKVKEKGPKPKSAPLSEAESVGLHRGPPIPQSRGVVLRRETPAVDRTGFRQTRSGRTSIKPVAWWKNERIEFSDDEKEDIGGKFLLKRIKGVIRAKEVKTLYRSARQGSQ